MANTRWLTPGEERSWRAYRSMRARLDLQLGRELADTSGLSESDYDVLSAVSEADGHQCRLKELAASMLWSPSRLSHHIARMEQRGLVKREGCVSDGRGAVIVLTPHGWRTIQAAAPGHVASVRRHLIDLLSPQEIKTLGAIGEKVVRHLNDVKSSGHR
ncbi:MAG: MarR family winged helix-turn-helix transcriptional regulator [Actinomycetota bacterium]|nr:MarR family winged helix-turn-helix transcriptional regulator [Actinomycetota bacterium]